MMTPQEHLEAARDYAIETILSENKLLKNNVSELTRENAELKRDKEDLIFIRNQSAKCMCKDKETITKAKDLLTKVMRNTWSIDSNVVNEINEFLKECE